MPSYRAAVEPLLRERIVILRQEIARLGPGTSGIEGAELEILSATADELNRLRGLMLEMDAAVERACRGPVPPGERILYLAEQVPAFFDELRAIREEQGK